MHLDTVPLDLAQDIQQIAAVEADLERRGGVIAGHFLCRGAVFGAGDRQGDAIAIKAELHRARLFGCDGRDPVDALLEAARIDLQDLVVAGRDDAAVIGESAVDQLRGQQRLAQIETDLGRRQRHADRSVNLVKQLPQFRDAFARHDHVGHALRAVGPGNGIARQPVAVGRRRLQHRQRIVRHMQEDAVEVIARFLGGNREACLVDDLFERVRRKLEADGKLALGNDREIVTREGAERKARAPGDDGHPPFRGGQLHLRSFGQLAGNVEKRVRRNGRRAGLFDAGGDLLVDLEIKVGRHQLDRAVRRRFDHHVRQDRNGIAPLDHGLDVAQALQQGCAFNRRLHKLPRAAAHSLRAACRLGQFAVSHSLNIKRAGASAPTLLAPLWGTNCDARSIRSAGPRRRRPDGDRCRC